MKNFSTPASAFHESPHFPYYIVSPNFSQKSSGPRMLHYLCHMLNELGYEAYITAEVNSPWLRTPQLTKEVVARHQRTGRPPIAVYPEIAKGNMLEATVAARWILNKAGHLGGETTFSSSELLFYWDQWVLSGENADRLFLPSVDQRIFNNRDKQQQQKDRQGFCYYAHKYLAAGGKISQRISAGGTSLCQNIPRTPEEIADILRQTQVLYCYEPSNIVAEAYACGCPVIMIDSAYLQHFNMERIRIKRQPESEIDFSEIPVISDKLQTAIKKDEQLSRGTLENFIAKTQTAAQIQAEYQKTPKYQLEEAAKAFHKNEIEDATNTFALLLDALPENPLPPAYLAFICAARGMPHEAQEFMDRAMEIAPHRIDLKAALGESYLKAGHPELAITYLQETIDAQADMLSAYPALAQSLHLTGRTTEAINLLQMVANIPGQAQETIRSTLLELLIRQGNIEAFCQASRRFSQGLSDDLLAARHLGRIDASGEQCVEALLAAQEGLAAHIAQQQADADSTAPNTTSPGQALRIAFLCSDFTRESLQRRLAALLQHLPAKQFETVLIIDDAHGSQNEYAQFCSLLADHSEVIFGKDDATALAQINALALDILIDLDGYGANQRLPVFANAQARYKLLWGESPLPPLDPTWLCIDAGNDFSPATVTLPGLSECLLLPELPFVNSPPQKATLTGTRFACLTPAIRIPDSTWQLFTHVLDATPESHLTLNLHDLDSTAESFIRQIFTAAGIVPERLDFVRARSLEAVCRYWQQADIGLAPPVDAGEIALPCCLWMGRPYIALASPLPWSQRPATLLAAAGANEWLAQTPEEYLALATRTPPPANPAFRTALQQLGLTDPITFADRFATAITALYEGGHA